MAAQRDLSDLVAMAKQFGQQLAKRTLEGASEAVLDEVQGVLRDVDGHIAGARARAASKRRVRENSDQDVQVKVVSSEKKAKRR